MLWVGNFRYSVTGCKESPNVISTSPQIFFDEQNWFHSSSVSWIPQNTSLAHRASIKNRIPYSSIAKSTSPGLSNTTFFARFHRLLQHIFACALFWIPRVNLSLKKKSFPIILFRFLETNVCWNQSSYAMNIPLTLIIFFAKVTTLFLKWKRISLLSDSQAMGLNLLKNSALLCIVKN